MDKNIKAFVVHLNILDSKMMIHLAKKVQIALLLDKKVTVLAEYSDFANIFLEKLANVFLEQTGANEHSIKLKQSKQSFYKPIYSLGLVKLELLKTYINTNLANSFIKTSKPPAGALILFVCKLNNSFCLCINY